MTIRESFPHALMEEPEADFSVLNHRPVALFVPTKKPLPSSCGARRVRERRNSGLEEGLELAWGYTPDFMAVARRKVPEPKP